MKVQDISKDIRKNFQHKKEVCVGDIVDSIKANVFGILILIPALVSIMPVSLIPGLSSLCALVVLFSTLHIFLGRQELWLPIWVRRISISGSKVSQILNKISTIEGWIDRWSFPRYPIFTGKLVQKATSCAGIALSSIAMMLGFLPLVDILLMLPVVFFGLGFCTQDGIAVGIGWGILGSAFGLGIVFI